MIDREEYSIDQAIPSERALIDQFGVSRITIRKAIDELVNEGYLYRIQGKGTFVKGHVEKQNIFNITSCTEDILKHGMVPSRKVFHAIVETSPPEIARTLQIGSNEKVFRLERLYSANFEPLNYTTTFLPYKIFPSIETIDFAKESLYETLEKRFNVKLTRATRSFEARLALEEIAQKLDLHPGAPLLLFSAVTFGIINGNEVPVECFESYYRTDKFKFYIDQVRQKSENMD
jgi:GntR family transcriptional regulator